MSATQKADSKDIFALLRSAIDDAEKIAEDLIAKSSVPYGADPLPQAIKDYIRVQTARAMLGKLTNLVGGRD